LKLSRRLGEVAQDLGLFLKREISGSGIRQARMKRLLDCGRIALAGAMVWGLLGTLRAEEEITWTPKQLKDPEKLAAALQDPKAEKPAVFNVGPVAQIKGAIRTGSASVPDNLAKLKGQLEKLPRDKEVVIYCGCCPFDKCPNVRPALALLKEMKFKEAKLLNLPTNLREDWVSRGFPMEP
jgi:thiosulfate/3-mercaptopyruvate sulfurtransferase